MPVPQVRVLLLVANLGRKACVGLFLSTIHHPLFLSTIHYPLSTETHKLCPVRIDDVEDKRPLKLD